MKIPIRRIHCFIALAFLSVICPQPSAFAQGTAFTYQGRLNSSGNPANGSYDLAFTLYNANTAGVAAAGPVTNSTVGVTNGLFTTVVDFGPGVFIGGSNWLEIAVSTNGANNFTTLAPRQQLTPAPYALYAPNAGNALTAASAGSVAAANITGALATAQLPASILTNGASGVNFSGTVAGNGLGITNLTIAALSRFQTPIVAWGQDLAHQTEVPAGLSNVVAIVAENASSLALKGDGTIVGWGNAAPPPGLSNVVAFAQGLLLGVALKSDGTVTNWPSGYTTPPAGLSNVTAVAAGYLFGMALRSNGMVVAWGYDNSYGQTNVPAGLSNVVAIAAGPSTAMALQSNGTVVAWGDNSYGQTNVPAGLSNVAAIAAGFYHCLAVRSNGTVVAWGAGMVFDPGNPPDYGQSLVPGDLSNVVAVAGGSGISMALRRDGTVAVWGHSSIGETNIPAGLSNVVAIAAGSFHCLALRQAWIPAQPALLTGDNAFQGAITAASFSGDGSGLTSLNANTLTGTLPVETLPASVVTNTETGVTLGGTFTGNGSGLTVPPNVVTNTETGVTLSGTFSGNGSGLTSLPANVTFATVTATNLISPKWNVTSLIDGPGPLPLTNSFTTHGGTLIIHTAGSGFTPPVNNPVGMIVLLDGVSIATNHVYMNASIHVAFVPKLTVKTGISAGTHTLVLTNWASTTTDINDYFTVTVEELPH